MLRVLSAIALLLQSFALQISATYQSALSALSSVHLRHLAILPLLAGTMLLTACDLPQVSAEDRLFLPISVEFLDEFSWPTEFEFEGTRVGGLSGIVYDRNRDRFYAVSDDHQSAARFYTLRLQVNPENSAPQIASVDVESVTTLLSESGKPYPADVLDAEGIALSPRDSVFISSEGVAYSGAVPTIAEFDLATGQWLQDLQIPIRFLPEKIETDEGIVETGIQQNLGFEALTINPVGMASPMVEPFRLFTATESALMQDLDLSGESLAVRNRLLHYLIGEDQTTLISEHLYPMTPDELGTVYSGLSELMVLDQAGHFLALERSLGVWGFGAKLYQIATGAATDTSAIASLKGDVSAIQPIRKRLLLDLKDLNVELDNLEGMTFGPRLPDGSQSLLLLSDNNFRTEQTTQFLLFRIQ